MFLPLSLKCHESFGSDLYFMPRSECHHYSLKSNYTCHLGVLNLFCFCFCRFPCLIFKILRVFIFGVARNLYQYVRFINHDLIFFYFFLLRSMNYLKSLWNLCPFLKWVCCILIEKVSKKTHQSDSYNFNMTHFINNNTPILSVVISYSQIYGGLVAKVS